MSLNEFAFCSRLASGTRQSSSTMSAFCTIRSAILFSIFVAVKPGVPFSTTKPRTRFVSTSRAQTTTRSAKVALPIQRLAPLSTHSSPSRARGGLACRRRRRSRRAARSARTRRSSRTGSSQAASDASAPRTRRCRMVPIASPECTPKNVDSDGSACAISSAVMPVSRLLGAGSDESGSAQSSRPSLRESLDELERELGPRPVVVDDRHGLGAEEVAYAIDLLPLRVRQQFLVGVEIGRQRPGLQIRLARRRQRHFDGHGVPLVSVVWRRRGHRRGHTSTIRRTADEAGMPR